MYPLTPGDSAAFSRIKRGNALCDTIVSLKQKISYYLSIFVRDSSGNWNEPGDSIHIKITLPDSIPPANITNLQGSLGPDSSIILKWFPSVSTDAESTAICYRTDGRYPDSVNDYQSQKTVPSNDSTLTLEYILNRKTVYISAFVKDSSNNWCKWLNSARFSFSYPPIATPGRDTTYLWIEKADSTLYLDGSGSWFATGKVHHFIWKSASNNPEIINLTQIEKPSFKTPSPGKYGFILQTFDGTQYSSPAQVVVTIWKPIYVSKRVHWAYQSITEGLAAASDGDNVYIDNEKYSENISIIKNRITLIGKQRDSVIIDGRDSASTVSIIKVSFVALENLRIIKGAPFPNGAGVNCSTSSSLTLRNVRIDSNNTDGVHLFNCNNVILENTIIENNEYNGIRTWGSDIEVRNCIFNNNCLKNNNNSIKVATVLADANKSTIKLTNNQFLSCKKQQLLIRNASIVNLQFNKFYDVDEGIYIANKSNAVVTMSDNSFENISRYCVWCDSTTQVDLSSLRDTMKGKSTPIWCNGATNISIKNNYIYNILPTKDINQKGIDIGGCTKGDIIGNEINKFAIGIIDNNSPVNIKNNIFNLDSIGICIHKTDSTRWPLIDSNVFIGCSTQVSFDCLP